MSKLFTFVQGQEVSSVISTSTRMGELHHKTDINKKAIGIGHVRYAGHAEFVGLSVYEQTITDLLSSILNLSTYLSPQNTTGIIYNGVHHVHNMNDQSVHDSS